MDEQSAPSLPPSLPIRLIRYIGASCSISMFCRGTSPGTSLTVFLDAAARGRFVQQFPRESVSRAFVTGEMRRWSHRRARWRRRSLNRSRYRRRIRRRTGDETLVLLLLQRRARIHDILAFVLPSRRRNGRGRVWVVVHGGCIPHDL